LKGKERVPFIQDQINFMFDGKYGQQSDTTIQVWPEEKYTRTGYSHIGVGEINITENLNNPVPEYNNQLFFAGEHTSANFTGFMEGSMQSAWRVAQQILFPGTPMVYPKVPATPDLDVPDMEGEPPGGIVKDRLTGDGTSLETMNREDLEKERRPNSCAKPCRIPNTERICDRSAFGYIKNE